MIGKGRDWLLEEKSTQNGCTRDRNDIPHGDRSFVHSMMGQGRTSYDRSPMKNWSSLIGPALCLLLAACGEGAILVKDSDHGGVVIYPYRPEQGTLLSSFRK